MFNSDSDNEWEKLGKDDPYFSVITQDKYKESNLTEESKEDFFRSGHSYIENVLKKIRKHLHPNYSVKKALDFGCGAGRLVVPLAEFSEHVTGVDVSESMLIEAKKNCDARSVENVDFFKSDDNLSLLSNKYDFIHSFIVFQHIPVKRGEIIFKNLLSHLEDGGVCVLHFTYTRDSIISKWSPFIKNYIPFAKNIINLIRGRSFFAPQMQMNNYNLNKIFFIMQKNYIRDFHAEYTDHEGALGIILYFRKPEKIR